MQTPRVTVIGSINADLAVTMDQLPEPGETVIARTLTVSPGGKGANQALAAARSGAETVLVGAVGRDAHAQPALELLHDAGVDLTRVATVDGPTGTALIQIDADGENSIAVVPGANAQVTPDRVRELGELSGVVVLQGEIPRATIDAAAAAVRGAAHNAGQNAAHDPAHKALQDPAQGSARLVLNLAPVIGVAEETILTADPLVANEHEAAQLLAQLEGFRARSHGPRPDIAQFIMKRRSPEETANELLAAGVRSVVLTLGGRGVIVGESALVGERALAGQRGPAGESSAPDGQGDPTVTQLPAPTVRAVDTTGAGDAFTGALAAQLAAGQTLLDAARFATRFAAASVQSPGAQASYPRDLADLPPLP